MSGRSYVRLGLPKRSRRYVVIAAGISRPVTAQDPGAEKEADPDLLQSLDSEAMGELICRPHATLPIPRP
jgi:hypothetical protein